jgi:sucrose-6-phosphate hydrolase SacC (GH32 family)
MLRWTWQATKLQPSFTGHGMFSGTGFLTKEGKPAVIYHGKGSFRNQIAVAKDNRLSAWEKPYPIDIRTRDGKTAEVEHWDPDCFLIGDTYYAISGGEKPPLMKSHDLKTWTMVGDFLKHELPDVIAGEDISCANFFPLGNKWVLLCISHSLGCRYYIGDWDTKNEQFVPLKHGRMNWPKEASNFAPQTRDYFAPESVLTPDGRRVMWAWMATLDPALRDKTLQSLPRELRLGEDGALRIAPLRELDSLRDAPVVMTDITVTPQPSNRRFLAGRKRLTELDGDAFEIRATVSRAEANQKMFGLTLFSDGRDEGLPIIFRPDVRTLRVGSTEAPFAVGDLPEGEDLSIRIFVDKYLVEVFVNDRQAVVAAHLDYAGKQGLDAVTFGTATTIKKLEIWKIKPTNQGFREAQKNRVWEPATQ